MASVTVSCPMCGESFPVPTELLGVDEENHTVLARMDRAKLYGHMETCTAAKPADFMDHKPSELVQHVPATVSKADLYGRIYQMLEGGHYVAQGGSRACTMCGVTGALCLSTIRAGQSACCPACGEGNTHRAPGESKGLCAEWSAAREAQS